MSDEHKYCAKCLDRVPKFGSDLCAFCEKDKAELKHLEEYQISRKSRKMCSGCKNFPANLDSDICEVCTIYKAARDAF
jgi:hypothetical protein